MEQRILTGYESQILKIGVKTDSQQQIRVIVSDADQIHTEFTNRYSVINGNDYFYVRMPLAPRVAVVKVFNDDEKKGHDEGFSFIKSGIWQMPLERKMVEVDIHKPEVRQFVNLAQRFSYNAGTLATQYYKGGEILFHYMPFLMNGKVKANTPARVGEITGEIEISAEKFIDYTVPMRMAILCHEFAHYYKNTNMYSEIEADLQGLLIYLGLGYPRIEAYQAFIETFIGAQTELNRKRITIIKRFIDDFETNKFLIYE